MRTLAPGSVIALLFTISTPAVAAPPPIEDFARSPAVQDVAVSTDGRYLSSIAQKGPSQRAVVVADRTKGGPPRVVLNVRDTDDFDISWCGWANTSRLLCGFIASVTTDAPDGRDSFTYLSANKMRYATTRLVGVNADGTDMKVLVQNDLFQCSVSIAGVSDLIQLRNNAEYFTDSKLVREQIGSDRKKLLEDSPLRHAAEVKVPVLLIHGNEDYTVPPEHTTRMASALKRADKRYEVVMIKKADHYLEWPSERVTLLTAVEKFLAANLSAP